MPIPFVCLDDLFFPTTDGRRFLFFLDGVSGGVWSEFGDSNGDPIGDPALEPTGDIGEPAGDETLAVGEELTEGTTSASCDG